jgi:hypothetical protein
MAKLMDLNTKPEETAYRLAVTSKIHDYHVAPLCPVLIPGTHQITQLINVHLASECDEANENNPAELVVYSWPFTVPEEFIPELNARLAADEDVPDGVCYDPNPSEEIQQHMGLYFSVQLFGVKFMKQSELSEKIINKAMVIALSDEEFAEETSDEPETSEEVTPKMLLDLLTRIANRT